MSEEKEPLILERLSIETDLPHEVSDTKYIDKILSFQVEIRKSEKETETAGTRVYFQNNYSSRVWLVYSRSVGLDCGR